MLTTTKLDKKKKKANSPNSHVRGEAIELLSMLSSMLMLAF